MARAKTAAVDGVCRSVGQTAVQQSGRRAVAAAGKQKRRGAEQSSGRMLERTECGGAAENICSREEDDSDGVPRNKGVFHATKEGITLAKTHKGGGTEATALRVLQWQHINHFDLLEMKK